MSENSLVLLINKRYAVVVSENMGEVSLDYSLLVDVTNVESCDS